MSSKLIIIVPDRMKHELDAIAEEEESTLSELIRGVLKAFIAAWMQESGRRIETTRPDLDADL